MERNQSCSTKSDTCEKPAHILGADITNPTFQIKEEDEIHIYQENGKTLVVSHNRCGGQVGLQIFVGATCIGEMWVDHEEMAAVIGETNPSDRTIIARLGEYIE